METISASAIAVLGTLLGVWVSYWLQRSQTPAAEANARQSDRREELITACSSFAEVVMHLRRVQYDRWWRHQEGTDDQALVSARDESYQTRATAWTAFYRLRLLSPQPILVGLARRAIDAAAELPHATSEDHLSALGDAARDALEAFVTAAASQLRARSGVE